MVAGDKLLNGSVMGAITGALVAGTKYDWLNKVVDSVMGIFGESWNSFDYAPLITFAGIGLIIGLIIDRY